MLGIPKLTIFIFNNLLKFNKTTTYKKNSEYIKKNYLYFFFLNNFFNLRKLINKYFPCDNF